MINMNHSHHSHKTSVMSLTHVTQHDTHTPLAHDHTRTGHEKSTQHNKTKHDATDKHLQADHLIYNHKTIVLQYFCNKYNIICYTEPQLSLDNTLSITRYNCLQTF